jgi:hypothetical protein
MSITMDQFTEYCSTSSQYTERRTSNATPHTGPVHTLQSSLDDWKKGVKPDMTLYPILKHDRQFDTWNRVTKAVPDTQGLSNVLDHKYAPTAIDAIALFKEQKIFMFAVFSKILLTDQGKKIVRAHEIDFDAQVIYEELRDYSLESTRSSLGASKILTHITLSRIIDDRHWRGTTHGCLLHWQDQVRQYYTMVPESDCFHDNQLWTMIQNAIKTQAVLQVVQFQPQQFKVQNGRNFLINNIVHCLNRLPLHSTAPTRINPAPTVKFTLMISSLILTTKPAPMATHLPRTTSIEPV